MKQIFLLLIYFTICFDSYSQCTSKMDEYDGYTITHTEYGKISSIKQCWSCPNLFFKVMASKITTHDSTVYALTFVPEFSDAANVENEFIFLTKDKDVIKLGDGKLKTLDYKSGEAFSQGTSNTIWYENFTSIIDHEFLLDFANTEFKGVKVNGVVFEIDQKKWKKFWRENECILRQ